MIYKNHMGETVEKYQYELFLREFISESQLLVNEHMKQFLFGCELSVNEGRRYDKIVASDDNDARTTRVWAFIDKTNGNILKPATIHRTIWTSIHECNKGLLWSIKKLSTN
jgi:hypothetical protein